MPSGWCDNTRRSYDPKRDMRWRRTLRRRMRHALHKKDQNVLSEKGECRGEGMGASDAKIEKETWS